MIRRLTFDLTGLPPTFAEVQTFLDDKRPDAYERLVDRLLASPHYGERWARYWLDVARYADTKGYVFQEERRYPYSFTYRDYVVRAFNSDVPYNQFLIEQLAADRLGPQADPRALAGLGYVTLGRRFLNVQADIIDDRIDVVSRGLLGLTVGWRGATTTSTIRSHPMIITRFTASSRVRSNRPIRPKFRQASPMTSRATSRFNSPRRPKRGTTIWNRSARQSNRNCGRTPARISRRHSRLTSKVVPPSSTSARADKLTPGRLRSFSTRWRQALDASKGKANPVFGPWHAFAGLSADDFSRKAPGMSKALTSDDPKVTNPVVAQAFAAAPPGTMAEVAARYADLLSQVSQRWDAALKANPKANALPDADWERFDRRFLDPTAHSRSTPRHCRVCLTATNGTG